MSDLLIGGPGATPRNSRSKNSLEPVNSIRFSVPDLNVDNAAKMDFGEHILHINETLLSQLDVFTEPRPQRNLPFVQDAVAKYFGEIEASESTKAPSTFFSKWNFFSADKSDFVGDYHALSRLYAAVYSQFPNEADVHIDHTYIDNLNHDVWHGGRPTEKEVDGLRRQMNYLLGSIGIQDQI